MKISLVFKHFVNSIKINIFISYIFSILLFYVISCCTHSIISGVWFYFELHLLAFAFAFELTFAVIFVSTNYYLPRAIELELNVDARARYFIELGDSSRQH